jgi:hypothetical protein
MRFGDAAMLTQRRPDHRGKSESFAIMLVRRSRFNSNSNQVPLILASRRHDYANDLPSPPSRLPPFFFHLPSPAPSQQKQYSAQGRPSRAKLLFNLTLVHPISALCIFTHFYLSLFLSSSAIHLGRVRVPFPRDFRPRSSRRDKGVRVKERV